jgi:hypothetical protein
MSTKFYCNHKECKKAYYFDVPDEIMIDENNMGAFLPLLFRTVNAVRTADKS